MKVIFKCTMASAMIIIAIMALTRIRAASPAVPSSPVKLSAKDTGNIPAVHVTLYPNPVIDQLTVKFDHPVHAQVMLLRMSGDVLVKKQLSGTSKVRLDMSNCSTGWYLVRINRRGKINSKRVYKQ